MPRKRKASDPEELFEVDEHGNIVKDYGPSADIPSLSVPTDKLGIPQHILSDKSDLRRSVYGGPDVQVQSAPIVASPPLELPSIYTQDPVSTSYPGIAGLQRQVERENTTFDPSGGFTSQTQPAPPGADPNYQPGLLAALNRELGGAMSNVSDPAWLNRQIGGAMSGVGDAANATSQGVLDFLSRTGEGIYNALPSRQTVKSLFDVLRDTGISATPQGALGLRELEMRRDINLQNIQRQQAQQQEQKRQHDLQLIQRIITSDQPSNVKAQMLEQSGTPQGQMLSKALKDADYQSFQAYMKYIPQEVQQRFAQGQLDPTELSAWLDQARTQHKEDLKLSVERAAFDAAMSTPPTKRTPSQQRMVDEQQAALELKKADTELKKAQAERQKKLAEQGGSEDRSFINKEAEALMNKPWAQLSQPERQKVLEADQQRQVAIATGRAFGAQEAQLQVPDKPSASERKELAEDLGTLDRIHTLAGEFDKASQFVGPARGRIGTVLEAIGMTGYDESTIRSEVASLRNNIIKLITGAQMSEPEAKRIRQQIPELENSPETFRARLHQTQINAYVMALRKRDILAKTGVDIGNIPPLRLSVTRAERLEMVRRWVKEEVSRSEIERRLLGITLLEGEQ